MGLRGPKTDPERAKLHGTWKPSRHGGPDPQETQEAAETREHVSYCDVAREYSRQVLAGEVPACRLIRLAVQRQERDLAKADWEFYWDEQEAENICAFAERLPHVEGRWKTALIHLEPVQCWILTTLFGWRKKEDGTRRFNTAYIEVARKFGKSVLASIIGLYCLCRENEPGAQVKCAATTNSQARVVFNVARKMVLKSEYLRNDCGLTALANAIAHDESGSSMQPINAKSSTQDGLNPHCTIIDELHAHKDRGLYDVLRSARGARSNPLSFYITTAGYNMLGVCYEQRTFITKVLQGIFDADHYFGAVFTLDVKTDEEPGDDPWDEATWIKANPMLGITPKLKEMQDYAKEARLSPSTAGEFKTKRLNLWLQSAFSWLSMAKWDACADTSLKLSDFEGQVCWMGVDLSQLDDITAVALVFKKDDVLYVFVKLYLPRLVVDERAVAVPAYRKWLDDEVLVGTEGNTVDYDVVQEDIEALCKRFKVQKVVFDQFGSNQIGSALIKKGIKAELLPKNAKAFTPPCREMEVRIKHGKFRHDGHEALRWQASNVVVTRKVDETLLPKKDHPMSPNKIDAIDAILNGISAMLAGPVQAGGVKAFVI